MKPINLNIGDVVQISPESQRDGFFAGCFMQVTEPKPWGAQGYICMPGNRGTVPGRAFFRAKFEDISFIGRASWSLVRGGEFTTAGGTAAESDPSEERPE